MKKFLYPLDIQLFAEGDGAGTGGAGGEGSGSSTAGASGGQTGSSIDYEQLADVISRRTSGTEDKVLQGYFKQQGLSSEQAAEAIRQYKESQKQKRDDEANRVRNMEQENARLKLQIQNADIDKEITSLAAKEGVSAEKMPFLLKMVERDGIIGQDGKLQSDKAKEALEAVLKAFPELDPVWLLQGKGPMYANVTGFPAAHERSIGEEKVSGGRSQDSLEVPELPFEETGCVSTPEVSSILSGTDAHDVAPQPEDPDADECPPSRRADSSGRRYGHRPGLCEEG